MKNTILLLLIISLSSCSFLHKISEKHRERRKHESHATIDSASVVKSDTVNTHKIDSTGVSKKDDKKDAWWQIDIDSSEQSTVIITQDSTGNQTVKATGKIKQVKGKLSKVETSVDSVHKITSDSLDVRNSQTANVKKTISEKSREDYQHNEVKSTKFKTPWMWLLVPLVIALIIYVIYRNRERIKDFIIHITTGL